MQMAKSMKIKAESHWSSGRCGSESHTSLWWEELFPDDKNNKCRRGHKVQVPSSIQGSPVTWAAWKSDKMLSQKNKTKNLNAWHHTLPVILKQNKTYSFFFS